MSLVVSCKPQKSSQKILVSYGPLDNPPRLGKNDDERRTTEHTTLVSSRSRPSDSPRRAPGRPDAAAEPGWEKQTAHAAAAAAAAMAEEGEKWECPVCMFENLPTNRGTCEFCG